MDPITLLVILSSLAGIAGFLYLLTIGQKSIPEWIEHARKKKQQNASVQSKESIPPPVSQLKIPNNLPSRSEFIGREKEKQLVVKALKSRSYLIAIDGIGGIGKTALAIQVAHQCLEVSKNKTSPSDYPIFEAIIWISAKDKQITIHDVWDTIARTLGLSNTLRLPPDQKEDEIMSVLRNTCCLIILDNFETIEDTRIANFAVEMPEPSKLLITTREQRLQQAYIISLREMDPDEAFLLMRAEGKRLGLPQIELAENHLLARIYKAVGGAPLAIRWSIGQIKQRGESLDTLLESLYEAKGNIFENIFARSWQILTWESKLILVVIALHPSSVSKIAIEAASDLHRWDLDEGLGQLIEMWLVEEVTGELEEEKRRYSVNVLTRTFARTKMEEIKVDERLVLLRAANFYLKFLQEMVGTGYWCPTLARIYNMIDLESENILGLIDWCYQNKEWQLTIDMTVAMVHFFSGHGYWRERVANVNRALDAISHLQDRSYEVIRMWFLIDSLGWIYCRQGELDQAEKCLLEGKALAEQIGDACGIALSDCYLSWIARDKNQPETALQLIQAGLAAQCENLNIITQLYTALGSMAFQAGDYSNALRHFEQALAANEKLGKERTEHWGAMLWTGDTLVKLRKYNEAKQTYEKLLDVAIELGITLIGAKAKYGLAVVEESMSNKEEAIQWANEAAFTFEQLGMKTELELAKALVQRCSSGAAGFIIKPTKKWP